MSFSTPLPQIHVCWLKCWEKLFMRFSASCPPRLYVHLLRFKTNPSCIVSTLKVRYSTTWVLLPDFLRCSSCVKIAETCVFYKSLWSPSMCPCFLNSRRIQISRLLCYPASLIRTYVEVAHISKSYTASSIILSIRSQDFETKRQIDHVLALPNNFKSARPKRLFVCFFEIVSPPTYALLDAVVFLGIYSPTSVL